MGFRMQSEDSPYNTNEQSTVLNLSSKILEPQDTKVHVVDKSAKTDKPYACKMCPKTYKLKRELNRHLVSHTDKKRYQCELCDSRFQYPYLLSKHIKHVHQRVKYEKKYNFKCELCPREFYSRQGLENHQYQHTRIKKFICDLCGSRQGTKGNLTDHIKRVHNTDPSTKTKVQCHICGASFVDQKTLGHHISYLHGDGKPKCHICGKIVSSKEVLRFHINYHTGEKPFNCQYCTKSFASKYVMRLHERTHTGEAPYKCDQCPKTFKQRTALTSHLKSKHIIKK